MIAIDQIREITTALNGVEEGVHFKLPTFKVNGKGFMTVQKDAIILATPQALSEALVESEPNKYGMVWRNGQYFVGIKVNSPAVGIDELKPLIGEAYRNRA